MTPQPSSPVQSEATVSDAPALRTRSGRVSKPPERYEPVEQVEDDYAAEDYDTEESSDVSSEVSYDTEDELADGEDDADEDGNLDGFVVPDKSESDSEGTDDGKPAVPIKKRGPVAKRPATAAKVRK